MVVKYLTQREAYDEEYNYFYWRRKRGISRDTYLIKGDWDDVWNEIEEMQPRFGDPYPVSVVKNGAWWEATISVLEKGEWDDYPLS